MVSGRQPFPGEGPPLRTVPLSLGEPQPLPMSQHVQAVLMEQHLTWRPHLSWDHRLCFPQFQSTLADGASAVPICTHHCVDCLASLLLTLVCSHERATESVHVHVCVCMCVCVCNIVLAGSNHRTCDVMGPGRW